MVVIDYNDHDGSTTSEYEGCVSLPIVWLVPQTRTTYYMFRKNNLKEPVFNGRCSWILMNPKNG